MKSVSICHAPADRARARELARYIEVNFGFDVSLEDAAITPERDILPATECALSANFAIVLFSPVSIPAPLKRSEWEPVFVKARLEYRTPIAFVLLDACPFPELLKRQPHFFDLALDWLAGARSLKRWMMSFERQIPLFTDHVRKPHAESAALASLWPKIVDQPGSADGISADVARALADDAREDFEAVHRFQCAGRHLAVVFGELGAALALGLPGSVEENRCGLASHCAAHRYLLIFDGAPESMRDALNFGGRCSVVFTTPVKTPAPSPVTEISIANIAEAIDYALALLQRDAEAGGRLGSRITFVLSEHERYAEADLLLEAMQRAGCSRAEWMARERAWIHGRWEGSAEIPGLPSTNATQLPLFGDAEWLGA